jgi:hypothetical protein
MYAGGTHTGGSLGLGGFLGGVSGTLDLGYDHRIAFLDQLQIPLYVLVTSRTHRSIRQHRPRLPNRKRPFSQCREGRERIDVRRFASLHPGNRHRGLGLGLGFG